MGNRFRSAACERVRAQIALELDRDFSQLERARRVTHVAHCAECRAFEADLVEFTRLLREAPRERPARPFSVPRRRLAVPSLRVTSAAAAAMVLALVGLTTQLATDLANTERAATGPTRYPTAPELQAEITFIEVLADRPRLVAENANLR